MNKYLISLIPIICLKAQATTFNNMVNILEDKGFTPQSSIEQSEYAVYQNGHLPQYEVSFSSVFSKSASQLSNDTKRTLSDSTDAYVRLQKLLHANGVCLTGKWKITEQSKYSGLFKTGTEALFVGRASVTMGGTQHDEKRGFALAGKVFPTLDPNKDVTTANFFSIEVLLGIKKHYFMDAKLTNEPEVGFDLFNMPLGLKIGSVFALADSSPGFRPLYPLSESNLAANEVVKTPRWFRIQPRRPQIHNSEKDFRNEIIRTMNDNGKIIFDVEVSDAGSDREDNSLWNKIGEIETTRAILSYSCDRRIHFPHPKMK